MAGTIRKRGNKYLMEYMYKGKRYSRTIDFNNEHLTDKQIERELPKMLSRFVLEVEDNITPKSSINFISFSQMFIDKYARTNLEQRTIEFYLWLINGRLVDYFGNMQICEIRRLTITNFLNDISKTLTKSTLKKYRNCLVTMFNQAIKWGIIEINPATNIDLPKGKIVERINNVYSQEDVDKLLDIIKNIDIDRKIVIELALKCGLRRSEIMALNINDFDFTNNTVTINKAISNTSELGTILKSTKTQKSNRVIYVAESLLKDIKEQNYTDNLFNFDIDNFSAWFTKFIKSKGLPHITLHGLRHTHATLLIGNNIDVKTVSDRLGHSNISTTLNIYTHTLKENDKKASEFFN